MLARVIMHQFRDSRRSSLSRRSVSLRSSFPSEPSTFDHSSSTLPEQSGDYVRTLHDDPNTESSTEAPPDDLQAHAHRISFNESITTSNNQGNTRSGPSVRRQLRSSHSSNNFEPFALDTNQLPIQTAVDPVSAFASGGMESVPTALVSAKSVPPIRKGPIGNLSANDERITNDMRRQDFIHRCQANEHPPQARHAYSQDSAFHSIIGGVPTELNISTGHANNIANGLSSLPSASNASIAPTFQHNHLNRNLSMHPYADAFMRGIRGTQLPQNMQMAQRADLCNRMTVHSNDVGDLPAFPQPHLYSGIYPPTAQHFSNPMMGLNGDANMMGHANLGSQPPFGQLHNDNYLPGQQQQRRMFATSMIGNNSMSSMQAMHQQDQASDGNDNIQQTA